MTGEGEVRGTGTLWRHAFVEEEHTGKKKDFLFKTSLRLGAERGTGHARRPAPRVNQNTWEKIIKYFCTGWKRGKKQKG